MFKLLGEMPNDTELKSIIQACFRDKLVSFHPDHREWEYIHKYIHAPLLNPIYK